MAMVMAMNTEQVGTVIMKRDNPIRNHCVISPILLGFFFL